MLGWFGLRVSFWDLIWRCFYGMECFLLCFVFLVFLLDMCAFSFVLISFGLLNGGLFGFFMWDWFGGFCFCVVWGFGFVVYLFWYLLIILVICLLFWFVIFLVFWLVICVLGVCFGDVWCGYLLEFFCLGFCFCVFWGFFFFKLVFRFSWNCGVVLVFVQGFLSVRVSLYILRSVHCLC